MSTKLCHVCGQEKPVTTFAKGNGTCMKCRNDKIKHHYIELEKPQRLREEFLRKYNYTIADFSEKRDSLRYIQMALDTFLYLRSTLTN